jgi:hypothetical protein
MSTSEALWSAKVAFVTAGFRNLQVSEASIASFLMDDAGKAYFQDWKSNQQKRHQALIIKCRDPKFSSNYDAITTNLNGFEDEIYSAFKQLQYQELVEIAQICGSQEFLDKHPELETAYYPGLYQQNPQKIPPELDRLRRAFFIFSAKLFPRNVYAIFSHNRFCTLVRQLRSIGNLVDGALRCLELEKLEAQELKAPVIESSDASIQSEELTQSKYPDKYWHCLASPVKGFFSNTAFAWDLTYDEMLANIINPCRSGHTFLVGGNKVKSFDDLERLKIVQTDLPYKTIIANYKSALPPGDPLKFSLHLGVPFEQGTDYSFLAVPPATAPATIYSAAGGSSSDKPDTTGIGRVKSMTGPSQQTTKRLFALSGNRCAFPGCPLELVRDDVVIAEICHIKARKPGEARYDPQQTDEERHSFENLILMCNPHHKDIDSDEVTYTVERLTEMKAKHEASTNRMSDEDAWKAAVSLFSVNQSGGITANSVHVKTLNMHTASADEQRSVKHIEEAQVKARNYFIPELARIVAQQTEALERLTTNFSAASVKKPEQAGGQLLTLEQMVLMKPPRSRLYPNAPQFSALSSEDGASLAEFYDALEHIADRIDRWIQERVPMDGNAFNVIMQEVHQNLEKGAAIVERFCPDRLLNSKYPVWGTLLDRVRLIMSRTDAALNRHLARQNALGA